jgi:hypothetical protein
MNEPFSPVHRFTAHLSVRVLISLGILASIITGCEWEDTTTPTAGSNSVAVNTAPVPAKPKYVRPKVADNGAPFPTTSAYIKNYPVRFTDGYSSVTVDNSKGNSDVSVKLYSLDNGSKLLIRAFFIRANDSFTAEKVRAGNYDVRYHDLNSGAFLKTESFNLQEIQTGSGVQFTRLRLTLYKVPDGEMETRNIPKAEF